MITGQNKQIACVPVPATGVVATVRNGVARIGNKHTLLPLHVIHGSEDGTYQPGDIVYLRSDQQAHDWFTTVFQIGGQDMILVPTDAIRLRHRLEK